MFLHITAYYYILFIAWGFQLDVVAEGNIGTLDFNRRILAIHFDGHAEEELQSTVPDVVCAQHKPFHPRRTNEDEVLPIKSVELPIWERPALQTLVALVYRVSNLQYPVDDDVSFPIHGSAYLSMIFG